MPAPTFTVTIAPCPLSADLEQTWCELLDRSDASAFLSWPWIGALLDLAGHNQFRLATIAGPNGIAGLALLGGNDRSFHLNENADRLSDGVMIEYNGVLAERGHEKEAASALLAALARPGAPLWRELILPGVPTDWERMGAVGGFAARALRPLQPAPFADLDALDAGDPLTSLSRNSREQVRRSMRHFEEMGPLSLDRARDLAQALDWFGALEAFHTRSWRARGKPGAFQLAGFGQFHRALIARGTAEGAVDLLRLSAGDAAIGYLYNLRRGGTAYAYQSGFAEGSDPRWRPGLVAHAMAMIRYQREGMSRYKFLAGEARYKRSLSNGCDQLAWLEMRRRGGGHFLVHLIGRLERKALQRLRKRTP